MFSCFLFCFVLFVFRKVEVEVVNAATNVILSSEGLDHFQVGYLAKSLVGLLTKFKFTKPFYHLSLLI